MKFELFHEQNLETPPPKSSVPVVLPKVVLAKSVSVVPAVPPKEVPVAPAKPYTIEIAQAKASVVQYKTAPNHLGPPPPLPVSKDAPIVLSKPAGVSSEVPKVSGPFLS